MKLPVPLSFDWNEGNLDKNWLKHKVSLKEAEEIFFNRPLKIFEDEKHSQKEERLLAYGITNRRRQLMIVFTLRGEKIRIISARNQNKKERRIYEKQN
ncbi:hypothetical protein COS55_01010 [Candidatus Shapirobacteria bacterium CG03_land_8_20_14_0_80_40_19]|uniref:BrnT family toxin n=3 Tax=Candidatus Shapironibacteriota TaxID=1752721 RepID=A0A2M7BFB4_9BACT|nr:MAG: hypothetical protein COV89_03160 [Candidatus Shapirobacteria bacterium CG11_big_fil_rev_8_21_14_0_20_40_12]PIV01788.1 MAG: hypothetical protein COS55_01010 [Candidatus Shapirobacteria bacterium CG03_land_8_20_14_0_80_40_19]PJC77394.1 MAG: hypothetical protein CO010_00555 [Candidatus Shapirobacteria bacterium CG_4_8_14_3_um_filter_39_11]